MATLQRRRLLLGANPLATLVTSALLAYYDFAQGSGQQLTDQSGNGKHGQLGSAAGSDTNDPAWATAGLVFDGVDDYVNVDALAVYNNGSAAFTVMAVVKAAPQNAIRLWGEGNTVDTGTIASLGSGAGGTIGKALAFVRDAAAANPLNVASIATVFDNTWHSAAWSDNNGAWALLVDGLPDSSGSYTRPSLTLTKGTIGALGRATYGSFLAGTLAALLAYNRPLSAAEVLQNHRYLKATLASRGVTLP